jgi:hypothetical protein
MSDFRGWYLPPRPAERFNQFAAFPRSFPGRVSVQRPQEVKGTFPYNLGGLSWRGHGPKRETGLSESETKYKLFYSLGTALWRVLLRPGQPVVKINQDRAKYGVPERIRQRLCPRFRFCR